jgi:hypothetical protein
MNLIILSNVQPLYGKSSKCPVVIIVSFLKYEYEGSGSVIFIRMIGTWKGGYNTSSAPTATSIKRNQQWIAN